MKFSSTVALPFLRLFFTVALIFLQTLGTACQDNQVSRVRIKLHDLPSEGQHDQNQHSNDSAAKPAQALPACPPAGITPLEPLHKGTGDHKVTLSWNASRPSDDAGSEAVGYCLYRSTTKMAAQKNPTCKKCEQVNAVPVTSTGCIDNLVVDGANYYYVVTAINAKGLLSIASPEISVSIPSAKQSLKPPSASSVPLCRGPAAGSP